VATAVIAVLVFKENAGKRLWLALSCMTVSGVFLAWDPGIGEFKVLGPIMIVIAMVCWGIDNNLTRQISDKDPIQTALIKGLIAGTLLFSLAYVLGMKIPFNAIAFLALILGAISYGVSLVFFIKALERLGSFRTGIYFNLAPFVGAAISLLILREWLGWIMLPATACMVAGYWLMIGERHSHVHVHEEMMHTHAHDHKGLHHTHTHPGSLEETHIHEHTHGSETHAHAHWPDSHHRHLHDS
jgi:drug/metabolite transporter (DMT)-like permease